MNKLTTINNGGFPVFLDDLRWVENANFIAFKGVLSMLGSDAFNVIVLSGCVRSVVGSTVSFSTGYVVMNGEIFFVPAHSFTDDSFEYWTITESFDANGDKTFFNAVTNQTYLIRTATVVPSPVDLSLSGFDPANSLKYFDLIRDGIDTNFWINLITIAGGGGSIPAGTYEFDYKKGADGFIHLRGTYPIEDIGSGAVNELIGTLPTGFRPAKVQKQVISIGTDVSGNVKFSTIEIATNGEVRIKTSGGLFVQIFNFDEFSPFEAV